MRAAGFAPEDYEDDEDTVVWLENWDAFNAFRKLSNSWIDGFSGRTGLNWLVVFTVLDREAKRRDWAEDLVEQIEEDIRVMEREVLPMFHEKRG